MKIIRSVYYALYSFLLNAERFFKYSRINLYRVSWLFKYKSSYRIIKEKEVDSAIIFSRKGHEEVQYFPAVYNITKGGELNVSSEGCRVYVFDNPTFALNSDFIRLSNQNVFCDKLSRKETIFSRFGDSDLYSVSNDSCRLSTLKNKAHFNVVFHMSGCYSKPWAHFLAQYFPRLEFIKNISCEHMVDIVLPNTIDNHIVRMIEFVIKDEVNFRISLVPEGSLVVCSKLFYASIDTYIGDIGVISTPFHIQLSNSTVTFLVDHGSKISEKHPAVDKKKLFIGRVGKRNIGNYSDVLNTFKNLGFVEVFPHLLSFEDKVKLFNSAEFIAGPVSSGFANIIFCKPAINVLMLANPSRHDDMFLTKIAKYKNIRLGYLLGVESDVGDPNSNYTIDVDELMDCIINFAS
jgi:capsular polysaccharide biosynthesis protein